MTILSLDSGLERTGYAVFEYRQKEPILKTYGCIITSRDNILLKRFGTIAQRINVLIQKHSPEKIVFEQLFFNLNKKTFVTVAQSQGVVISQAIQHGVQFDFITPLEIKLSLTGYGRADKLQVQRMVKMLLKLEKIPKPDDTADAIACGLAYLSKQKFNQK